MIDWSIFDKQYPVENGIVNALPLELASQHIAKDPNVRTLVDIHEVVMKNRAPADYINDSAAMANLQMDYYDTGADGFQGQDDTDQANGGVFWWKVARLGAYDARLLKGKTILFVGAGNGRLVRFFSSRGFQVVATDISRNMLAVGKRKNESMGITGVTYVAQNAEVHFPFRSQAFDNVYSLCVMNHIVNWNNYLTEKLRCVKRGGVVLERLPNADLWDFWKMQGVLYEGIEAKAKFCNPASVRAKLAELEIPGEVWTHDHQTKLQPMPCLPYMPESVWYGINRNLYRLRSSIEDRCGYRKGDGRGIYTMFRVVKP